MFFIMFCWQKCCNTLFLRFFLFDFQTATLLAEYAVLVKVLLTNQNVFLYFIKDAVFWVVENFVQNLGSE